MARDLELCVQYVFVAHGGSEAIAVTNSGQYQEITDGCRYPYPGGSSMCIVPEFCMGFTFFKRFYDRGAAFGLDCHHPRALAVNPADCFEFFESLPHADQTGTAAGRIKNHVW